MRAREGDLLETQEGVIFDVKGLVHPPDRIVAFPRFVLSSHGDRKRKGDGYRKVYALLERYELVKERFPQYLVYDPVFGERLCEVLKEDVRQHYSPVSRLQELREGGRLDELETDALRLAEFLVEISSVPWNELGISGSLLATLHTPESDIDPIVYGRDNCILICKMLKSLIRDKKAPVRSYTERELRTLYDFRSRDTKVSFDDFVKTESRKTLQGKFLHRDFYIRCIKNRNEIGERYGDVIYRDVGYAKIKATVSDDSEAIFTPCRYSIDDVQLLEGIHVESIMEIASFRGRFCEQARKNETVIVQGKVEKVEKRNETTSFRILLGGKPSDFMVLAK